MSNRIRLPKPKRRVCKECQAGNHTGHSHMVCPSCGGRIDPDPRMIHVCGVTTERPQGDR